MRKLLVICGPTATGKTKLALHLSKVLASSPAGEIVSADSRQVYRGMDIGTGKDLPANSNFPARPTDGQFSIFNRRIGSYSINGIRVWGYDLVEPTQEFSVAHYIKFAQEIIKDIFERGKLPILVGGTGLYVKGVVDGIDSVSVPQNRKLRKEFSDRAAEELFEILRTIDPAKTASMNMSDRKNPRRLVRAIEVAKSKPGERYTTVIRINKATEYDTLFIGLRASKKILEARIVERVHKRVKQGIKKEVINLLAHGVDWSSQSMNALGYRQWKAFFEGEKNEKGVIDEWIKEEKKYAKRQITWFKKDKRISWFDISAPNWKKDVETIVRSWYYKD